ncbi:hypothetical protein H0A66_08495 [Alcaligenaceae bacterium]|nr:hypothetical protein [Alcaligenaceae bacterium]
MWRYALEQPVTAICPLLSALDFANEWVTINGGWMRVSEGYAWDGCSPSIRVPGTRIWLGTPDGPLGADGRPVSWRASLLHDALCQFRHEIPGLKQAIATGVFAQELVRADAPWLMTSLYPAAVLWLGPRDFPGDLEALT